jgi:hippurate hydrolase
VTLDLLAIYQDLHRHPELAFSEHRTASVIADRLSELGVPATTGVGGTGVVGLVENGDGPVIWLRADIDGLPVHEKTGLPYASEDKQVDADGTETFTMHACGHDIHITWLLGALERLVATKSEWSGTVVAIFQPAEENIRGARAMVADGLLDRFPEPSIVLGQHSAPSPVGVIGVGGGPVMAASDRVRVRFVGQGGHGSAPQTTLDPIVVAASAVVRLQTIVSRETAPTDPVVVTVGTFHSGTRGNIIPDDATIELSTRARNEETRARVLESIDRIVRAEAAAGGLPEPEITREPGADVLVNDDAAADRVLAAVGPRGVRLDLAHTLGMASEDVNQLSIAAGVPIVYWFTGIADPAIFDRGESAPSNHSPFYAPIVPASIPVGVDAFVDVAREFLAAR